MKCNTANFLGGKEGVHFKTRLHLSITHLSEDVFMFCYLKYRYLTNMMAIKQESARKTSLGIKRGREEEIYTYDHMVKCPRVIIAWECH